MQADHQAILDDALASPEGQQFQQAYSARVTEITSNPQGFAVAEVGAVDWTNVITVVTKLAPVIFSLLSGWSPAKIVELLPSIIGALFPNLDPSLVTMLQTFLAFLVSKIPNPTT